MLIKVINDSRRTYIFSINFRNNFINVSSTINVPYCSSASIVNYLERETMIVELVLTIINCYLQITVLTHCCLFQSVGRREVMEQAPPTSECFYLLPDITEKHEQCTLNLGLKNENTVFFFTIKANYDKSYIL